MKKIIPVLIVFVMLIALTLTGCGTSFDAPDKSASISSNGGSVVRKGDYVYYVNGYEGYETLAEGNKNQAGSVSLSSIYVAKIEDGKLTNQKQFVSKVAGFENTSLYIFDNFLYYLTPTTKKDADGKVRYDLVTLAKIRLDGKKSSEVYTVSAYTSGKFAMIEACDTLYALFYTGEDIIRVNVGKNKSETIASGVTSVAFSDTKYVYYTRNRNESEGSTEGASGNISEKIDVCSLEITKLSSNSSVVAYTEYKGGRVYYTKDSNFYSNDYLSASSERKHNPIAYTSFTPLGTDELGNQLGFIVQFNSKAYYQTFDSIIPNETPIVDSEATILGTEGDYVYYLATDVITRYSVKSEASQIVASNAGTISTSIKLDFDNDFVYFLTKPESAEANLYLYSASKSELHEGKQIVSVCGDLADADEPDESDDNEEEA